MSFSKTKKAIIKVCMADCSIFKNRCLIFLTSLTLSSYFFNYIKLHCGSFNGRAFSERKSQNLYFEVNFFHSEYT